MGRPKLVRDNMPELCETTPGWTPMIWWKASKCEMIILLENKLSEEVEEVIDASIGRDRLRLANEIADLLEVVRAICRERKISLKEVETIRKKKLAHRGGFKRGVVWNGEK